MANRVATTGAERFDRYRSLTTGSGTTSRASGGPAQSRSTVLSRAWSTESIDDTIPAVALIIPDSGSQCSFCEYLNGDRPYTILDRDSLTATLVTREQRGQGHVLVIPVEHHETILDVPSDVARAIMDRVTWTARMVADAYAAEGIAIWQNNGVPAHQSVPHVHVHVAATRPEGGTSWGAVPALSVEETDAIAARLRTAGASSSPRT